ncbi:MAG: hypothetical protein EB060_03420 [Proteobacteria bacterium]|nr:hypothetical protein [Pseudomonadota bacterium]
MPNEKLISMEEKAMQEMDRKRKTDKDFAYKMKLPSIKRAQAAGIPNEEIEQLYGVKIRPADKKPVG